MTRVGVPMLVFYTLFYFVIQGIAVVSLGLAHRLYVQYRLPYLRNGVYFLVFLNAFAFLKITGRFFLYLLLDEALGSPRDFARVDAAVTFIAYPFLVVSTYFFYAALRSWVKKTIAGWFKVLFVSVELAILVLVFLEMYQAFRVPSAHPVFPMMMFLFIASCGVFEFLGVWQLLRHGRALVPPEQGRFVFQMGVYYLAAFTLFYIVKLGFWGPFVSRIAYPLMYCTLHLYPLIRLSSFLKQLIVRHPLGPIDEACLLDAFRAHGISAREQEVFRLLLEGLSNTEIEARLFISIRTVRNHLHSVYGKLGVKSRMEAMNRFYNVQ